MATNVTLPALGESVTEGTVTQWLKEVGDSVEVDEPLLEVSTDKVDTEIPSPVAGTLLEIKADEDETVEVGALLAVIGDEGEDGGGDGAGGSAEEDAPAESEGDQSSGEDTDSDSAADKDPVAEPDAEPTEASSVDTDSETDSDATSDSDAGADAEAAEGSASDGEQTPKADTKSSGAGTAVVLPALGESVTEGTVTQWLKEVGDEVAIDDPLLEISTDKVDTEIPSPVAGTLLEIKADEDETVEVGAELAIIGEVRSDSASTESSGAEKPDSEEADEEAVPEGKGDESGTPAPEATGEPETPSETPTQESESASADEASTDENDSGETKLEAAPAPAPTPEATSDDKAEATTEDKPKKSGDGDSYVTPIVRKLARQHDVDLGAIIGTGVGGRIRKQDVLDAAPSKEDAKPDVADEPTADAPAEKAEVSPLRGKTEKLTRLRKTIATRMLDSLQNSAQVTTVLEVDVTEIARARNRHKEAFAEREGVNLSFLSFFAKATVEALKLYPQVNASLDIDAGTVTYPDGEHLGIAVDTERGLLVPVIRDSGDLSIPGLARKIADVAERTRTNKIKPDELSGGTFTLTNTGSRGALFDTPIINQPQSAILGTGVVVKRPVVISDGKGGESIAVRHMIYLALTYDHRIVDGADAARFLTAIKNRLEDGSLGSGL